MSITMNVDLPATVTFDAEEKSTDKATLNFTAITNVPIVETTHNGKKINLTVDLDSTTFSATKLYKDHVLSTDSVIAKIADYKVEDRDDGFKALVISAEFFPDIKESRDIYQKYKLGLLDSVSIGIKDIEQTTNKQGDKITYRKGNIYEVSAVFDGRDPNAKIRDQFNKIISQEPAMEENKVEENVVAKETTTESFVSKEDFNSFKTEMSTISSRILDSITSINTMINNKEVLQSQQEKVVSMGAQPAAPTIVAEEVKTFNIVKPLDSDAKQQLLIDEYGTPNIDVFAEAIMGKANPMNTRGERREWNTGFTIHRTLDEKWCKFYLDQRDAFDNSCSLEEVIMSRRSSDKFDTTKTTDILPTIPTPRQTTKLWDIFKKDSALLRECTTIHHPDGKTHEFSVEAKPFTAKAYDEGAVTEYQKYTPTKVNITMTMIRMAVELTYEAKHTPDVSMITHLQGKMMKDFGNAIEEIGFQSDSTNKINGILKLSGTSLTKDNAFLKNPSCATLIALKNALKSKYYNMSNVKLGINGVEANNLSIIPKLGNNNSSPENTFLYKGGEILGVPVIITDGLKAKEGIFGDFKNIFFVSYCQGIDFQMYVDADRNVKLSIWMPIGVEVGDRASILHLTNT